MLELLFLLLVLIFHHIQRRHSIKDWSSSWVLAQFHEAN